MRTHILPQSDLENLTNIVYSTSQSFLPKSILFSQQSQSLKAKTQGNQAVNLENNSSYIDDEPFIIDVDVNGNKCPITLEFTKDQNLLEQYYNLREQSYRLEWGFSQYRGLEVEHDRKSNILIARFGNKVVGGARLAFSNKQILSNEDIGSGFTYFNAAKSVGIDIIPDDVYTEVSALVIDKNFRANKLLPHFLHKMVKLSQKLGARFMCGTSDMSCNRIYSVTLKKIGYQSKIIEAFSAPQKNTYNDIKMFPIVVFL